MNDQIQRVIDLAAATMIAEMYPNAIDLIQIANLIQKITSGIGEQPSAEMLINFLVEKYE